MLRILYIGDIMGEVGIGLTESKLTDIRKTNDIDVVIAQAENTTDGRGISPSDFNRLKKAGVDFCTGGNWSLHNESIWPIMSDPSQPIIRPANYPLGTPGLGYKYLQTSKGQCLVISLLGGIIGKDANKPKDNPLTIVDKILASQIDVDKVATIVNFHGDYSSEKVIIGHYLDGRVTAVVGDHWHVPTADARVLPKGTAHISDVGMCGALDASLGVSLASVIPRWRDGISTRNVLENSGPKQFNGIIVESNENGLAESIEQFQQYYDI